MTTQTEAMKLALEALETERPYLGPMPTKTSKAIAALREALAEQPAQQDHVAWPHKWGCRANAFGECNMGCTTPQPPAQREWVGLTQEEIDLVWDSVPETQFWWRHYARAIEAKLREKNT
jgi:hypothetical protein